MHPRTSATTNRWRSIRLAAAWLLVAPVCMGASKDDVVRTRDGQTLRGTLSVSGELLRMTSADGKVVGLRFDKVDEIVRARAAEAASTPIEPGVRHGLKAEYYLERDKAHTVVRLDGTVDYQSRDSPSFALEVDYCVRWTGRVVAPTTGTYTFSIVGTGAQQMRVKVGPDEPAARPDPATVTLDLTAGRPVDLTAEIIGVSGNCSVVLRWGRGTTAYERVPSSVLLPPADFTDSVERDAMLEGSGSGLYAEIFQGEQFDKPLTTILDPIPSSGNRWPTRMFEPPYSVRWTGRLSSPADGDIELNVTGETRQPVRVWIDGRPILDTFETGDARKTVATIPAKQGQMFDLRIESVRAKNSPNDEKNFVYWKGPRWKNSPLPKDRLYPPASTPRPVARVLASTGADDAPEVEVLLAGRDFAEPVTVGLYTDKGQLLAGRAAPPYRFTLDGPIEAPDPPANDKKKPVKRADGPRDLSDVRRVIVRATDARGRTGVARPIELPLPAPSVSSLDPAWFDTRVGSPPRTLKWQDGASIEQFTLFGTGGTVLTDKDDLNFLFQPLAGDGAIQATLSAPPKPNDEGLSALTGGLMVRDGLDPRARYLAVFLADDALTIVRRDAFGALPSFVQMPGVKPPAAVRLRRTGARVVVSTSADGATWTDAPADPMPVAGVAYAGVTNLGNPRELATFKGLQIDLPGADELPFPAGVRLTNGTSAGGQIKSINDASITLARSNEPDHTLRRADVSAVLFQPVAPQVLAQVAGRRGVLMPQGDVLEGDVTSLTPDGVSVDSIIFGPRAFKKSEALAVLLNDLPAPAAKFEVRLADGSFLLAGDVRLEQGVFQVVEPSLGVVRATLTDVTSIRRVETKRP